MAVLKFVCEVQKNIKITDTVFELHLKPDIDFAFEAGQFIMLDCPNPENAEKPLKRSYSVGSPPEEKIMKLCIKHVENGKGTPFLKTVKPGDSIKTAGPFGRFTYKTPSTKNAFFIATGTGIAPFYSMIYSKTFKSSPPQKIYCALGVRFESEILYIKELGTRSDIKWIPAISQPSKDWKGFKGRVTDYLRNLTDLDFTNTEFYLCGSGDMIREVKSILIESKSVAKENIHQEIYF